MKEYAQPQTIEAKDGFPIHNPYFYGSPQEQLAILDRNKPVSVSNIADELICNKKTIDIRNHQLKWILEDDPNLEKDSFKINYEDVSKWCITKDKYKQIRKDKLAFYQTWKEGGYYFLMENIKKAYVLWSFEQSKGTPEIFRDLSSDSNIWDIIRGILLGYKKKDIRAWFVMGLEGEFKMDFNNPEQRKEYIHKPEFIKRRNEIWVWFETRYNVAQLLLNETLDKIVVPDSWRRKVKLVKAPKNAVFTSKTRKTKRLISKTN